MSRTNKRLALFMGLAVLFLVALFGRTFYVQVVAAPGCRSRPTTSTSAPSTLDAPRGTIYDRNGETLAISQTMATRLRRLRTGRRTPRRRPRKLAPVLGLPEDELLEKLTQRLRLQVPGPQGRPGRRRRR